MYLTNRRINGQYFSINKPVQVPKHIIQSLQSGKLHIQSIDPGIVMMATRICTTPKPLFENINQYQALVSSVSVTPQHEIDTEYSFNLTARKVNTAIFLTSNRKGRERKTITDKKMKRSV